MRHARVNKIDDEVRFEIEPLEDAPLSDGEVRIQVAWSAVNYKDGLAASANPGVARTLPLTPGIDAAGVVLESRDSTYSEGQQVLATGHDFGVARDGGWSQTLDAPAKWLVPLPAPLETRQAMILGTAGFTAMQCVEQIQSRGLKPEDGAVLVTGASGGVGSIAVALLASAGFQVTASTGKEAKHAWLRELGATDCIGREQAAPDSDRPMLKSLWAAAVDTVGGNTLSAVVRSLKTGGAVAACGVVAGPKLDLTVYPFILRGVSLIGIDSAWHPYQDRLRIWDKLAQALSPETLEKLVDSEIELDELDSAVQRILQGGVCGRILVRCQ